ncbi:hypothetical protein DFJ73DRAFT_877744 [Zopfochytrium polystomum]|nr:hypothetical protein DFJ73DRAFT_877744 [Zopfochytrium polystomum]
MATQPNPSSSVAPSSAHQDVMQFLQDLDSIVPADAASSNPATGAGPSSASGKSSKKSRKPAAGSGSSGSAAASSAGPSSTQQEVLSFLDELTSSTSSTSSSASPPKSVEASGRSRRSSTSPRGVAVESFPGGPPQAAEAAAASTSLSGQTQAAPTSGGWSWNSIWSTAQATAASVQAATASSLKIAEAMVEETAKAVTSDKVKGLMSEVSTNVSKSVSGVVNNESLGKLGTDLSKLTMSTVHTLTDALAPTLARGLGGSSHLVAETVTVWLCPQIEDPAALDVAAEGPAVAEKPEETAIPATTASTSAVGRMMSALRSTLEDETGGEDSAADRIHDFVQSRASAVWLGNLAPSFGSSGAGIGAGVDPLDGGAARICRNVVVNSVTDPSPRAARGIEEALKAVEATLARLRKLADAHSPDGEPAEADGDGDDRPSSPPPAAHDASTVGGAPGPSTLVPPHATVFMVVQPFATLVPASAALGGATAQRQYLAVLSCAPPPVSAAAPAGGVTGKAPAHAEPSVFLIAVSQSVNVDAVAGGGGGGAAGVSSSPLQRWMDEQVNRVVRAASSDLIEEFAVRMQHRS